MHGLKRATWWSKAQQSCAVGRATPPCARAHVRNSVQLARRYQESVPRDSRGECSAARCGTVGQNGRSPRCWGHGWGCCADMYTCMVVMHVNAHLRGLVEAEDDDGRGVRVVAPDRAAALVDHGLCVSRVHQLKLEALRLPLHQRLHSLRRRHPPLTRARGTAALPCRHTPPTPPQTPASAAEPMNPITCVMTARSSHHTLVQAGTAEGTWAFLAQLSAWLAAPSGATCSPTWYVTPGCDVQDYAACSKHSTPQVGHGRC